jgi:prefoldin alpha subunit
LVQLSKALEGEIETLSASYQQLMTASQKFGDSK